MANELLSLLQESVAFSMSGNKKVACVLSGGIDSSTIAELSGAPTFTGFYDQPGFDERQFSRLAGKGYHHEVEITPQDFVDNFWDMARAIKPPWQGMGTFGQYMVGKRIGELGFDVALSGEGADELFGGYARLMHVAGVELPLGYESYKQPESYPTTLHEALVYDWLKLPNLLAVDDQCMAAHGVKAVAPFMDPFIVAYAHRLPDRQRVGKTVLNDAVKGVVHDVIINRRDKMGFPCPLVSWCQEEPVRSFVGDFLGWVPDPETPWDRAWWYEMLDAAHLAPVNTR